MQLSPVPETSTGVSHRPVQFALHATSVVSHKWLVFRREGFSCPTRRERRRGTRRRAAALRVAPRLPRGFVVRPSQTAAGRLHRHASPRGSLGRNDAVGSAVLAGSSFARASSFARYGTGTGPRLAHSSSCESICGAINPLPTESFRLGATQHQQFVRHDTSQEPHYSPARRRHSAMRMGPR